MNHVTSIGLDVHARSITAAAFNPLTGEMTTKRFKNAPTEVADWILSFESPKAVYESGVTGFALARHLQALGVDCTVGAVSKMQRPAADKRRKNDRIDAEFLARLLATHNIVEVFVPDEECEAIRDLTRALDDVRGDLVRARHRLTHFLMRKGLVFDEENDRGQRVGNWTKRHWEWIRAIRFQCEADEDSFAYYISEIRHLEATKRTLEKYLAAHAKKDRWKGRVEAMKCMKGIDTSTAIAVVAEVCVFSRFPTASAIAAWAGLVPSEHSSGEHVSQGSITKSGNRHLRHLLVEAAWHYSGAHPARKRNEWGGTVPLSVENHAAKGVKRLVERRRALKDAGKRPCVANVATARELLIWCWALGRMCEGTL